MSRVSGCTGESIWSLHDGLRQSGRAFGPAVYGTAEAVPLTDVADGFMHRGADCHGLFSWRTSRGSIAEIVAHGRGNLVLGGE